MIDDDLHQAASDLRRGLSHVEPPPFKPKRDIGGRVVLVVASIAVFVVGGVLITVRGGGGDPVRGDQLDVADETPDGTTGEDRADDATRSISAPVDLVTDTRHRPATAMDRPSTAPAAATTEPEFGTPMAAVTAVGPTETVLPLPGGSPAWNADGSLILLYERTGAATGHALYDGRTFERLRSIDIEPEDVEQVYWDPANPERLLYTEGSDLMAYRLDRDEEVTIHRFDGCALSTVGAARPVSTDGSLFGFVCRRPDGGAELVAYTADDDGERRVPAGDLPITLVPTPSADGFVVRRPDGAVDVLHTDLAPTGVSFQAEDDEFVVVSVDGDRQLYVTTIYDRPVDAIGSVVAFDLATGETVIGAGEGTGFPYPPSGTRLSAPLVDNGLVVATLLGTTDTDQQDTLDGEIIVVDFNPTDPSVYRLGHHRGTAASTDIDTYWALPTPAIRSDGRQVLFTSDWGGDRVDTFVIDVEIPSD